MPNDDSSREPAPGAAKPPVVGIGASAGGIEALQSFFATVPDDLGLAYVVIVHLAPDRDSSLPEILARQTTMPVTQVGDHSTESLAPNRVYVIAPDRKLEITDTSVGASRFEEPRGRRAAIDLFFRSLAARHGDGFAVVLSGTGSDGALGAKAVKEAGGVVLVQDPREASHPGMPRAVISTGMADVVLPVRELAERLAVLSREKGKVASLLRYADHGQAETDASNEAALKDVFDIVRRRVGHDFSKYKRGTVLRRLARRMQLVERTLVADYVSYLRDNIDEVQALFDDLLITVTTFFRDPLAWTALQQQVIGPLVEQADHDEPIRVWVPGCATGEEAYTFAIAVQEELERRKIQRAFTIFASDVDEGALATAREAAYPSAVATDISAPRLERYFRLRDDHYCVASDIREHVVFATHSLLRDPPFSKLHVVSCRNLLIYLNRELQEQVIGLFHYACRNDGYLFLGVSETADEELFRPIDKKHRIFQVHKAAGGVATTLPSLLASPRGILRAEREPRPPSRQPSSEIHVEALEAVAPPSVVVDDRWNLLHLSSSAARFLQQRGGPFARQITDAVRPELRDEVHAALHRAFESAAPQLSDFVPVRFDGSAKRVAVLAQRHRVEASERAHVLLTFLEAGDASGDPAPTDSEPSGELVRGLREKLRHAEQRAETMRDDHHLANEDLRAANEELQSLNEEYRSTTEELETSKEELQSINEELQTVNHELKTKIDEISRAHDDLENLMAATNIATLFLDQNLRINRFTPPLTELFNVTSRDHGRPIGDFTHKLDYDTLEEDARAVLAYLRPFEREVTVADERTFIIRIAPYRTVADRVEGVVVTLVDVSQIKQAESVIREREARFRALVDASAQMVWTTDEQGRMVEDSPSWRAFTGQSEQAWKTAWLDAVHPDDREHAGTAWRASIASTTPYVTEFRVFRASSGTYRWTSVRAVPLKDTEGSVHGWVGMNTDVTERREAEEALRASDRRKDEFLAMLGHELRNPLAAIRSSVAVHSAAGDDPDLARRTWAVVDRQSVHMTRLVNDLLDIMRIDRGKLRLERTRVALGECITDVVTAMQPRADAAGLTLEVDLPAEPLYVNADAERVVQVLDNLLRNAVTYTDEGGRISIAARKHAARAVVTVRDTGIGIDPDQIDALFEPYRQGDGGRRHGGLGLGLTLIKRLVELHGGRVSAHSDGPGTGSEFQVELPLASPPPVTEPLALESLPPPRRVLVVDDEADVADMFAVMLAGLGQRVEVAHSGAEALEAVRRQAPDVAFLDLSMPSMSGAELALELRTRFPDNGMHLVALSGFSIDIRTTGREFDDHLLKPASVETILGLLNSL